MMIAPRLQPYLMALLAAVGMTAFVGFDLYAQHGLATQESRVSTANLARLLEEHTRQSLRRVEQLLSDASAKANEVPAAQRPGNAGLRVQLQGLLPNDGLVRGLVLIQASGAVQLSTLAEGAVAQIEPAAAPSQAEPAGAHRMVIAGLSKDRDGRWFWPMQLRPSPPDARQETLLVALVDPAHFQPVFNAINVGTNGFVTMFVSQGRIVATAPANEALFARDWSNAPMFNQHLPHSPTGTVQQVMVRDGTERVYSYRALPDYPVVVSVGVSLTDAMADWRALARADGLLLGAIAVLLLGTAAVMARNQARREAAERALADSAQQTLAIVSHIADGILSTDRAGKLVAVNRAAEAMFGYTAQQLLGRNVRELIPSLRDWSAAALRSPALESGRADDRRGESVGLRSDGQHFPINIALTQTARAGQELYIGLVRDISERKRQDAELRDQRTALEVLNRELEDFAFFSSHDLQEPLRKIRSFSQLLRQRNGAALDARGLTYLDFIEEAVARLQALVRNLLAYSHTSRGALHIARVDLNRLAAAVVSDLAPAIAEAQAELHIGELPPVDADATQLRSLLQNLVSNALKFRDDVTRPEIEISAALDGDSLRLCVRDNGIGIDPKYHDTIFESFKRLHTREKYRGTGLGLSICTRVAERHGGHLQVESAPGQGSLFTLILPIQHLPTAAPLAATEEALP